MYDVRISDELGIQHIRIKMEKNSVIKHEFLACMIYQRTKVFEFSFSLLRIFFSLKKTLILAFETNSATSLNCTYYFFFYPNVVDRKCKAHGIFNNILTFWHHTVIKYSTILYMSLHYKIFLLFGA